MSVATAVAANVPASCSASRPGSGRDGGLRWLGGLGWWQARDDE
jgi:hypothetical protein